MQHPGCRRCRLAVVVGNISHSTSPVVSSKRYVLTEKGLAGQVPKEAQNGGGKSGFSEYSQLTTHFLFPERKLALTHLTELVPFENGFDDATACCVRRTTSLSVKLADGSRVGRGVGVGASALSL